MDLKDIFKVGGIYTTYHVGEMMAWTVVQRFKVNQVTDDMIVFTPKGKRKKYIIRFETRQYSSAPLKPFAGAVFDARVARVAVQR